MKRLMLVLLLALSVIATADTEVKYFCKDEKINNGSKCFTAPDTKINEYLKKLGTDWRIIATTADSYGVYVTFERKVEITISVKNNTGYVETLMKQVNDYYLKGYKVKHMCWSDSAIFITFER